MIKPLSVRYAFVAAALSAFFILVEHWLGYNTINHEVGEYSRMIPMLFAWAMLFYCMQAERKENSVFTYMDAFKTGAGMFIVYSLLFTLIIIIYQQFINPEFYSTYKAFVEHRLDVMGASADDRANALREVEMSYNGSMLSYFLLFLFSSLTGIILSAVLAVFLRRK